MGRGAIALSDFLRRVSVLERPRTFARRLAAAWDLLAGPRAAKTPLAVAAGRGDTEAVERLLREGAAPDVQDGRGWTALHEAVARGHVETAACLLAHGAKHTVADKRGRTPLGLDFTSRATLHAIRQRYHRLPARDGATGWQGSQQAENWARDLDRRGIIKVSGLIEPDELAQMQNEFGDFIGNLESKLSRGQAVYQHYDEEEHWWPKDLAYVSNNAFKYSRQLVKFSCHATLLESANLYLGKPAFVQRGVAMRYLPTRSASNDMFGWHHDMEEKRFKVMILLSDVGEHDQYMSYVLGSHKIFHPYKMFFRNRCSLHYCRKHLSHIEIYHCLGKAGDIFIFDSNGAHRGNRHEFSRIRDVFLVEYSADTSNFWGGDIDPNLFNDMLLRGGNPFGRMMAVEKKWNLPVARRAPMWVETLSQVETWL